MEITIDELGRIVIPKKIREELYLTPGEPLKIEISDNKIILKTLRDEPSLYMKEGVLVFSGTPMEDLKEVVRIHREKYLKKFSLIQKK